MPEIRWILLGAGVAMIAVIWWRSTRRDGQAQAPADLRNPVMSQPSPPQPSPPSPSPTVGGSPAYAADTAWSVSPLEPLSIKTADFDRVPVLDMPMMTDRAHVADQHREAAIAGETTVALDPVDLGPRPARADDRGRFEPTERKAANRTELQKIVALRICPVGEGRWSGKELLAELENEGLAFGRYQVFHRNHADGASLFCIASLIEPGSFDRGAMSSQEFRGVAAFAVLPGPAEPVHTVEAMIATSRRLAERLSGTVQDGKGIPFSTQRSSALLEEVARFQAQLA